MKHLSILAAALLLAFTAVTVGISPNDPWPSTGPKAAHAVASSMCWAGGYGGTVYDDNNYHANAGGNFYDTWQGRYTHVNSDIHSWNYTPTAGDGSGLQLGHCYRQIRYGGWVDDGSYGSVVLNWQFKKCGSTVISGSTGRVWTGSREVYSGWYDFGTGGPFNVCAPQGSLTFTGNNPDWTPYYPSDVPAAGSSIN